MARADLAVRAPADGGARVRSPPTEANTPGVEGKACSSSRAASSLGRAARGADSVKPSRRRVFSVSPPLAPFLRL